MHMQRIEKTTNSHREENYTIAPGDLQFVGSCSLIAEAPHPECVLVGISGDEIKAPEFGHAIRRYETILAVVGEVLNTPAAYMGAGSAEKQYISQSLSV